VSPATARTPSGSDARCGRPVRSRRTGSAAGHSPPLPDEGGPLGEDVAARPLPLIGLTWLQRGDQYRRRRRRSVFLYTGCLVVAAVFTVLWDSALISGPASGVAKAAVGVGYLVPAVPSYLLGRRHLARYGLESRRRVRSGAGSGAFWHRRARRHSDRPRSRDRLSAGGAGALVPRGTGRPSDRASTQGCAPSGPALNRGHCPGWSGWGSLSHPTKVSSRAAGSTRRSPVPPRHGSPRVVVRRR
jgi:hypothetical protein